MPLESEYLLRIANLERKVSDLYEALGKSEPDYKEGDIPPEVYDLVAQNKTIEAIRVYREKTGCDLAVAKEAVDRLIAGG